MVSPFHVKRETGAQASRETMKYEGGVKYPPLLVLLVKVKYYYKIHKTAKVGGKKLYHT